MSFHEMGQGSAELTRLLPSMAGPNVDRDWRLISLPRSPSRIAGVANFHVTDTPEVQSQCLQAVAVNVGYLFKETRTV
ncbi:UNVERIFIED_CONTAM: hypothetical protein K2H54_069419 [Gekko kuhli]